MVADFDYFQRRNECLTSVVGHGACSLVGNPAMHATPSTEDPHDVLEAEIL